MMRKQLVIITTLLLLTIVYGSSIEYFDYNTVTGSTSTISRYDHSSASGSGDSSGSGGDVDPTLPTIYNCNVDSTIPSNCTHFMSDSNSINDDKSLMVNCTYINDCITVMQNVTLKSLDLLNINLANPLYEGEMNCNLYFDIPCQILISPTGATPSTVDCMGQPSFINHIRASLGIKNVHISNAFDSCINIAQNPTSLTIFTYNSVFENCTTAGSGGAIQASYPNTVQVSDTTFINNQANQGGAISAYTAFITNSVFIDNGANRGGAIYTDSNIPSSYIEVENCTFNGNNAHSGGAIYAYDLKTLGSVYTSNFAQVGGAILTQSINAMLCKFIENSALNGGAIVLDSSVKENFITLSSINNNTATEDGGALYILSPQPNSYLLLSHSRIFFNEAGNEGGAVYFNQSSTPFLVDGTFTDNISPNQYNSEFGCDSTSFNYNCNPCTTDDCTDCSQLEGSICISQGNLSYCYVSQEPCVFGSCHISSISTNVTCNCSSGFEGKACESPIPTPSPTPTPGHSDRHLAISMPIVFGSLVILFLVVIYIMIKKRDSGNSYKPLLSGD